MRKGKPKSNRGAAEMKWSLLNGKADWIQYVPLRALGAALILLLAGAGSPITQPNLSPIYGSIPASRYHDRGIGVTALLYLLVKPLLRQTPLHRLRMWLPALVWSTFVIRHYLNQLSGSLGPVYGPVVTDSCTYYPFLLLSLSVAGKMLEGLMLPNMDANVAHFIPLVLGFAFFTLGKRGAEAILPSIVGSDRYVSRYGLTISLGSGYSAVSPVLHILPTVVPVLWLLFLPAHPLISPRTDARLNKALINYNYTLLERKESLTGYISVLESHVNEFRVLRCDHSLLGGDWLVTQRSRARGLTKRETVYSVFTMLEAARLVERPTQVADRDSSALFIGLGIGTSPKAFIEHGINTTIVELDPVVHEFATKYFDLPAKHQAYLQDALTFVDKVSNSEPASYDYIVHDVFTGGAEPTALFTLEFLQGLFKLLKPGGIIAINYAADLSLPVPKIVLRTIVEVFPTCRIFRDMSPEEAGEGNTFVNMIVFCTKQQNGHITFRKAVESDWLSSLSRRQWIPPKESLEMPIGNFLNAKDFKDRHLILRRGEENKVERYHQVSAERHWRIMRTVLPDAVWELW